MKEDELRSLLIKNIPKFVNSISEKRSTQVFSASICHFSPTGNSGRVSPSVALFHVPCQVPLCTLFSFFGISTIQVPSELIVK